MAEVKADTDSGLVNRAVYEATIETIKEMVQEYHAEEIGIPDRIQMKAQAIFGASEPQEAGRLAKKCLDSAMTLYLSAWSKKKILGRLTLVNAEKKAKSAESLARHLDKAGQPEAAARQRERGAAILAMVDLKPKE